MPKSPAPRHVWVVMAAFAGLLAACTPALAPSRFEGRTPQMRPERFFDGPTASTGVMESAGGAPLQRFSVRGQGQTLPDGRFQLDQMVAFEGKPATHRRWVMSRQGPHHYVSSLTDAGGPVRAEAYGNLFHLAYPMKGLPFGGVEQWLYLQPDDCTVMNEVVVRVAGLVVRRLSERISRVGGGCPADPG